MTAQYLFSVIQVINGRYWMRSFRKYPKTAVKASYEGCDFQPDFGNQLDRFERKAADRAASELATAESILDKMCDGFDHMWQTLEDYEDAEAAYFELKDFLKTTSLNPEQLAEAERLCDETLYGLQEAWESLESDTSFWNAENALRDYLRRAL